MNIDNWIAVGSLVFGALSMGVGAYLSFEKRITKLEAKSVEIEKRMEEAESTIEAYFKELKVELDKIAIEQAATLAEIKTVLKFLNIKN